MDDMLTTPLTKESLQILRYAEYEAVSAHTDCIATDHLLIAFLGEPDSRFGKLLHHGRVSPLAVRNEAHLRALTEANEGDLLHDFKLPLSRQLARIVRRAHQGLNERTGPKITEPALLAALFEEDDCSALKVLRSLNFSVQPVSMLLANYLGKSETPVDVIIEAAKPNVTNEVAPALLHLSRKSKHALERAKQVAMEHGVECYGPAYLLYGIAATPGTLCSAMFNAHGVEPGSIKAFIAELTPKELTVTDRAVAVAEMTPELKTAIADASSISNAAGASVIEPEHLLLAILRVPTKATFVLDRMNIDRDELIDSILRTIDFKFEQ
jgi:ATP-dependent Clp protease ATP-binding subunit ClpA